MKFLKSITTPYAQVLFSKNEWFGALILGITFFNPNVGLAGIIAVIVVQITAKMLYFPEEQIENGAYTFNSMLVGLGMGHYFELNLAMTLLTMIAAGLTFFLTLWCINLLSNKLIPYLSVPFLLGIWLVLLGTKSFTALKFNLNEAINDTIFLEKFSDSISYLPFANFIHLYLRSLAAIFFQYSDLVGLLIAVGLFLHSRMAWLASILGFLIGYFFYQFMEGDFTTLIYTNVGFNFILSAIAISSFFMVPSRKSYAVLFLIMPLIALLIASLHHLFSFVALPMFSLPFNIAVVLFIAAMYLRKEAAGLNVVLLQNYSPEKNHYLFYHDKERFRYNTFIPISLPFWGEWFVSQGHNGAITHKGDWAYAWDFDIRDEENKTYQGEGTHCRDYYCYDLQVLAPAAGWVVDILDFVPDNAIGEVNLQQNWGNSIVIKHADFLYSKLSHLKAESFLVKKGDYVYNGQALAKLGNSGRSPEPHLHFQLQTTPYIGSKTLSFPISHYLKKIAQNIVFQSFTIPNEGETVSNIQSNRLLNVAFDFIPGKKYEVRSATQQETWEVHTSALNQTYIWCPQTKSTAWFINDGTLFYFTGFEGNTNSMLYHFYLSAYKVVLGFYENLSFEDDLPLEHQIGFVPKMLHDLVAPFFHFIKVKYHFKSLFIDNQYNTNLISYQSHCLVQTFKQSKISHFFDVAITNKAIVVNTTIHQKKSQFTISVCI